LRQYVTALSRGEQSSQCLFGFGAQRFGRDHLPTECGGATPYLRRDTRDQRTRAHHFLGSLRLGERQRRWAQGESLRGGEQLRERRLRRGELRLLRTRGPVERAQPRFGLHLAE